MTTPMSKTQRRALTLLAIAVPPSEAYEEAAASLEAHGVVRDGLGRLSWREVAKLSDEQYRDMLLAEREVGGFSGGDGWSDVITPSAGTYDVPGFWTAIQERLQQAGVDSETARRWADRGFEACNEADLPGVLRDDDRIEVRDIDAAVAAWRADCEMAEEGC